jgi:hypothetical protein
VWTDHVNRREALFSALAVFVVALVVRAFFAARKKFSAKGFQNLPPS